MRSLASIIGKYASPIVTGLVAATVVLVAVPSGNIDGAATGKKATKKKQSANVWGAIAKEVAPKNPAPAPSVNVPPPNIDLNPGSVAVDLPDEPLQDPVDPALCETNVRLAPREGSTPGRFFLRAEVRGYAQETRRDYPFCYVEIYPKGCDRTYKLFAQSYNDRDKDQAQQMCQALNNALFFKKGLYIAGEAPVESFGRGSHSISYISISNQSMDSFVRDYEQIGRPDPS